MLSELGWVGFVGDGRCVGLGPHPRIKSGAGSSPLAPNGKGGGRSRSLGLEMTRQGLLFERECEMPVLYEGVQVGTRRVDFFVEGVVLVELKAVSGLDDLHLVQLRDYLQVFGLEVDGIHAACSVAFVAAACSGKSRGRGIEIRVSFARRRLVGRRVDGGAISYRQLLSLVSSFCPIGAPQCHRRAWSKFPDEFACHSR